MTKPATSSSYCFNGPSNRTDSRLDGPFSYDAMVSGVPYSGDCIGVSMPESVLMFSLTLIYIKKYYFYDKNLSKSDWRPRLMRIFAHVFVRMLFIG